MTEQKAAGRVFIATSLDGYIARPNDTLDWLDPYEADGYEEFVANIDAFVLGSRTFNVVLGFGGEWHFQKPVVVMSQSLTEADIPEPLANRDKGKVELSSLEPRAFLEDAAERGWKRVYVDGGRLIQSFLRDGLIEEMTISRMPILLGDGIPLFGDLEQDIKLELMGSKTFPSGVVQSRYKVQSQPA